MRPILTCCASVLALAACSSTQMDLDVRDLGKGFDTSAAVAAPTAKPPNPDARGVISYPNYQVAVARRGDTVADVAARVGIPAADLARHNGLPATAVLKQGEVLALPTRVATSGSVDVESVANDAINRAGGISGASGVVPGGAEPTRHQVARGETAYSIARLYGVSPKSLADWNGLGPNLDVRVGQYLLIPVVTGAPSPSAETIVSTTAPGSGSPTPVPPSATAPLPEEKTQPTASNTPEAKPEGTPASPNLASQATSASGSGGRMAMPVAGSIVRDFEKGKQDGIVISAASGAPVKAADSGTVAVITEDTESTPIVVVRHSGGLLTVYAGVEGIQVKKGDKVQRGQTIAKVPSGGSSALHFEVRQGVDAVDPANYLN